MNRPMLQLNCPTNIALLCQCLMWPPLAPPARIYGPSPCLGFHRPDKNQVTMTHAHMFPGGRVGNGPAGHQHAFGTVNPLLQIKRGGLFQTCQRLKNLFRDIRKDFKMLKSDSNENNLQRTDVGRKVKEQPSQLIEKMSISYIHFFEI
jgi:hypothetical protein